MKKRFLSLFVLSVVGLGAMYASADDWNIPNSNPSGVRGATVPYTRYDSEQGTLSGGANIKKSVDWSKLNIATQASRQSYVDMPSGSSVEWIMKTTGAGVTVRFTLADGNNGMGINSSFDVYVNGQKKKTINISSYNMWQYFPGGNPSDTGDASSTPTGFAFDEVHFALDTPLKSGDRIAIKSNGGQAFGVDFVEVENIPAEIEQPDGAISVTDFGASPNDGKDDLYAFKRAIDAASKSSSKILYIPSGEWNLSGFWDIYGDGVKIIGAGIWYTNLMFTNPNASGGGICGGNPSHSKYDGNRVGDDDCNRMDISNFHMDSKLRSRYNQMAVYKAFMDNFGESTVLHDLWIDHFECGVWAGDYNGNIGAANNLKIINCRIRNVLADGVNFCRGTTNSVVYNCNIRNTGDDGLAIWNDYGANRDESGNIFAYNTIDFTWRAGGIGIYGGKDLKVYNNYICDMSMAAGIHFNIEFDGYKFDNTTEMIIENNYLVRCGTVSDSWNRDLAAIDFYEEVKNVTFKNNEIYDSPFIAIKAGEMNPTNIKFENTKILGAGLSGVDDSFDSNRFTVCAIRNDRGAGVTFSNTIVTNVHPDTHTGYDANSTWPVWTNRNADVAKTMNIDYQPDLTYQVPDYPTADNSQQGGIVNPLEGITGYDIVLKGLRWENSKGSTIITNGDDVTLSVAITNNSKVNIPAGVSLPVQVQIDGKDNYVISSYKDGLTAGQTKILTIPTKWKATAGGHTLVATADSRNKFSGDSNRENNSRTKKMNVQEGTSEGSYTAVTGGYDLYITNISMDKSTINANDGVVFTANIVNAGDQDIPAGAKIGVQFQLDGKAYGQGQITWNDQYFGGLKSHQSIQLTATGGKDGTNKLSIPEGTHTITAWVDDQNIFKNEVDENNNKTTISLSIPMAAPTFFPNPDKPDNLDGTQTVDTDPMDGITGYDLELSGLRWENQNGSTNLIAGDNVTFRVAIKNNSNVSIPAGVVIPVQVQVDGASSYTINTYKDGLMAGQTVKLTIPNKWLATAGGHTFTANVDYNKKFTADTNRGNNLRTKRMNVAKGSVKEEDNYTAVTGGYDLYVTKITFDKSTINPGDGVVFTATIVNAGDQDLPAGTKLGVQFQLDGKTYDQGQITWNDKHYGGLKSHETVQLTASGGKDGTNKLVLPKGQHTITAFVNDTRNYTNEVNFDNNKTVITLNIPYVGTPTSSVTFFQTVDQPDNIDGNGRTTAISGINVEKQDKATPYYDLNGRNMGTSKENLQKGIYIHNGKKIIIK